MPKLLKTNEVQLHMPRTGGTSLAAQLGVKKIVGTQHDGAGQIPDKWQHLPTVATLRDPASWRRSMAKYLWHNVSTTAAYVFMESAPDCPLEKWDDLNPTFGLWADPNQYFKKFCADNFFKSWYEAYISYFVLPADRIVKIGDLKQHINKS